MVTDNRYRWDFIGLSTDNKPTPATSDRVVDGSTFYCSDTSKLYVFCKDTWYEKTAAGGGGTYELPVASAETLGGIKVGNNLSINSETGVLSATDTTYSAFTGTDGTAAGTAGLVPAPATTDAGKFLKADGTWDTAGGGSGVTVVQTVGTSTTDVMSQDATSSLVYGLHNGIYDKEVINIGGGYHYVSGVQPICIGYSTSASGTRSVSMGYYASANYRGSIAIGAGAVASNQGEMNIGAGGYPQEGYNNTSYRLLSGVHDPVNAHDAATKGYVDAHAGGGGSTFYIAMNSMPVDTSTPSENQYIYSDWSLQTPITGSTFRAAVENGDVTLVIRDTAFPDATFKRIGKLVTGETYSQADFEEGNLVVGQFIVGTNLIDISVTYSQDLDIFTLSAQAFTFE